MIIHDCFEFFIMLLLAVLYYITITAQVTTTNNNIMASFKISSTIVGSTFVVGLCNIDEYTSEISFTLTKDNQQISSLNIVNLLLKY